MVQLATMIAAQAVSEYRVMLGAALTVGVTPVEVKEIVYQAVPYVGMAKVFDFLHATNDVLTERGVELPLPALMTSIGVTNRTGSYNQTTQVHDWKRRSERLVRASGRPYTIVRPGWFDYNAPDELQFVALQGDTRHAGNASDGVVARQRSPRSSSAASTSRLLKAKPSNS